MPQETDDRREEDRLRETCAVCGKPANGKRLGWDDSETPICSTACAIAHFERAQRESSEPPR